MIRRLTHELRLVFVALQFLTRVPVPRWVGFEPRWLNDCVRWFPLVGLGVGAVAGLVLWAASQLWPPLVAAALSLTATLVLTGAFHEDGLADTFDALGGAVPRERALQIMKDSRIGSYGAAALVLVLLLRVLLPATLLAQGRSPAWAVLALLLAHLFGRCAAVGVMATLPYAGDAEHAKAKPLATAVQAGALLPAIGGSVLLTGLAAATVAWGFDVAPGRLAAAALFTAVLAAIAVVLCMRRWLKRRLGGYTGDTLGATEQLAGVAVLLSLSAWVGA
jgi:adenosylcobinamide-GDP ribazoletransferase